MKFFSILFFFCCVYCTASAQNNTSFEIRGGAGILSDAHLAESVSNNFFSLFLFFVKHDYSIRSSGIYYGDIYLNTKNNDFKFGLTYLNEELNINEFNNDQKISYHKNNNSFLANVQYKYLAKEKTYFYSGAGLGVRIFNKTTTTDSSAVAAHYGRFAYDITGIGFHYGNKLGVFAEAGFGAKGILRAGINYSFK